MNVENVLKTHSLQMNSKEDLNKKPYQTPLISPKKAEGTIFS